MVPVVRRRGARARHFKRSVPGAEVLPHRKAYRIDSATFEVIGRAGVVYEVAFDGEQLTCTCEAGRRGLSKCWHRQAVARRLLREGVA